MVRACRPLARVPSSSWPARRSTMTTSTPANASSPASISPVGPPPAIATASSPIAGLLALRGLVRAGELAERLHPWDLAAADRELLDAPDGVRGGDLDGDHGAGSQALVEQLRQRDAALRAGRDGLGLRAALALAGA